MVSVQRKPVENGLLVPVTMAAGDQTQFENPDYAWTHQPATEIFFTLLTAVVVPYAVLRLFRRLQQATRFWRRPK